MRFYLLAPSNTTITASYNSDFFFEVTKQSLAQQQHVLTERHLDTSKAQQLQEQIYSAHAVSCSTPSQEHLSCSQARAG